MNRFFYCSAAVLMVCSQISMAAPEPAIVPAPHEWTLDVKFEHPQQIITRIPGAKHPQCFWYIILTVTNKTGMDVELYPKVEMMPDTFQLVPACTKVPKKVFKEIKSRHKSTYPFLESLEKMDAKILQGEDNTKDIVMIWPDFDNKAKDINIFIGGLSNETAVIKSPTLKNENGESQDIFLRKTLELSYTIAGDPAFRADAKVVYNDKRWIMR